MMKMMVMNTQHTETTTALIMRRNLQNLLPLSGMFHCGSCLQLDTGPVIGIIACDVILTFLIAVSVYCFVTHQRRRGSSRAQCCGSGNVKCHQPSVTSRPKTVEMESPYQELRGVQSDIYSDLQQFRK